MSASFSKPGWSVCLWGLLAAALTVQQAPSLDAASHWSAAVGAQSHDKGHQALAFLPNEIWIRAGDSVTWRFNADEIHTVSFLTSGQTRLPFPVGCPGFTASP